MQTSLQVKMMAATFGAVGINPEAGYYNTADEVAYYCFHC